MSDDSKPLIWPEKLTLRDTKVFADEGQRIFSTATGHGYEKREYVRVDASDDLLRQAIEALRAIVVRSQTDELGTSKVIDMRNLAAAILTAYDKREQS